MVRNLEAYAPAIDPGHDTLWNGLEHRYAGLRIERGELRSIGEGDGSAFALRGRAFDARLDCAPVDVGDARTEQPNAERDAGGSDADLRGARAALHALVQTPEHLFRLLGVPADVDAL